MTPSQEPDDVGARPEASPEANTMALVSALVGTMALGAAWAAWRGRPPMSLEAGTLWTTVLLMGLPLAAVYVLTGLELDAFGWRRGDPARSARYAAALVLLSLPLVAASVFVPASVAAWPHTAEAFVPVGGALAVALAWRAFVLEWFFRGFLLFGLFPRLGAFAVLIQTAAFGCLYIGAPLPLALSAWPAGFFLGFVAWRCGSFLPAAAAHIAVTLLLLVIRFLGG